MVFLSTPSGWRATELAEIFARVQIISIHALRVEGDFGMIATRRSRRYFYPRPPGGGRPASQYLFGSNSTNFYPRPPGGGRQNTCGSDMDRIDFYPRPPGGGRHISIDLLPIALLFLSTPSGWRATVVALQKVIQNVHFYPRPPGGGRLQLHPRNYCCWNISIHALRVEGDTGGTNAEY